MTVCQRIQYKGRVQGVGFRYTAEHLAHGFPVGGYVRNLPNGDVELVAEGSAEAVTGFLQAIGQRMAHYITDSSVQSLEPSGFQRFEVRY